MLKLKKSILHCYSCDLCCPSGTVFSAFYREILVSCTQIIFHKLSNLWSGRWETTRVWLWNYERMSTGWQMAFLSGTLSAGHDLPNVPWGFFQPGTWFLHLWQMAPPALDIPFVPLLSLDSEVRLPSIEASTLSPAKFSFPPKYWPLEVQLCLWDLTRLEASLACLQARSPCKQRSKCQKAAAEQKLLSCCADSFCTERSHYRCIFPEHGCQMHFSRACQLQ